MTTAEITYCANHPDRETSLRCNNCGKLICSQCAVHTPTGYRCRECVRGRQKVFDTATGADYVLAVVVSVFLGGVGAWLTARIGFFTILLAPAAGSVIAEAVRAVTGKRRSPRLFRLTAIGVLVGAAPFVILPLAYLLAGGGGLGGLLGALWPLVYAGLASSSAYYRLAGIQMNR
jgi:hypothetical protein